MERWWDGESEQNQSSWSRSSMKVNILHRASESGCAFGKGEVSCDSSIQKHAYHEMCLLSVMSNKFSNKKMNPETSLRSTWLFYYTEKIISQQSLCFWRAFWNCLTVDKSKIQQADSKDADKWAATIEAREEINSERLE